MKSNITLEQLAKIVREMRFQQNEYFRFRSKVQLEKSKNLEYRVDEILKTIPEPDETIFIQQNLFL